VSAGTSLALEKAPRRGFPRFPVKVPLDVIALRSGVPQNLPGRCTDVSEGGVGAMVAGELAAGQQVAVELRLPNVGLPLRARALVRYQDKVRCGFEFVGLAAEQREMIRYWSYRLTAEAAAAVLEGLREEAAPARAGTPAAGPPKMRKIRIPRRALNLLIPALLVLAALGWWRWQWSWNELEKESVKQTAPLRVPPEIMAARIVSKSEPVYPEEARRTGTQGLVVLDVLIGADGTVRHLQPASGNAMLAKSAMDAVQQWKFEPYHSSGRALEVETSIAVEFRLN
jgi:TonB family protein